MRQYTSVITLALLSALALAVVSGGLLPSDNAVLADHIVAPSNTAPVFASGGNQRSIAENSPAGVNIGDPIAATDADGDVLTYTHKSLNANSGHADSFVIDPATGQLITKLPLNEEDNITYMLMVEADDGREGTASQTVIISVTDEAEQPAQPSPPTLTTGLAAGSLEINWFAPENTGEAINDYDYRYKKTTETTWTEVDDSTSTDTNATHGDLEADTAYQVSVRAESPEGDGPWSFAAVGSTNKEGNAAPVFASATDTRTVAENTPAGQRVGATITATDANSTTLNYSLAGANASLFDIEGSTGQVKTKEPLNTEAECREVDSNHETTCTYMVLVVVDDDGDGGSDVIAVTITVTDVNEKPSQPAAPTVEAVEDDPVTANVDESTTSLKVSWVAPETTGPPIINYGLEYRKDTSGAFTDGPQAQMGTSATIEDLAPNSSYQVRVTANSAEQNSQPSLPGTGSTMPSNTVPMFSISDLSRDVDENTEADRNIGRPIRATESDSGDMLTYSLEDPNPNTEGDDEESFDIDEGTGQLKTKAALDHEATSSYTVTVTATDQKGATDTIEITITVEDVDEPPSEPSKPTVTVDRDNPTDTLEVTWAAPNNEGKPQITEYEVEYRTSGSWISWNHDSTNLSAVIPSLSPYTNYQVQVRAINDEGESPWVSSSERTSKADNTLPVFTNGSPTLEVQENTARGLPVGGPVEATDDDDDDLTYILGGEHASLFDIDDETGQIEVKEPLNLEAECGDDSNHQTTCTYNVDVKVTDGNGGSATADVTIRVTDQNDEAPSAPSAPTVRAAEPTDDEPNLDPTTMLEVTWAEPQNDGPTITVYAVQYKVSGGNFVTDNIVFEGNVNTNRSVTIHGLDDNTSYQVQVMATNDEGDSVWSPVGTGSTRFANTRPEFSRDSYDLSVDENTTSGRNIGRPVDATDDDGHRLTYTLEGVHKDQFTIDRGSGHIRTRAALDYESRRSYSLTVRATDTEGASAAVSVTIDVDDKQESPTRPGAPTVSGVAGSTSDMRVAWDAPSNDGRPRIVDYDVQYREVGKGFKPWHHDSTDTSTIITDLSASTQYEVQIKAWNMEDESEWSLSGRGSPDADPANNAPVYTGGVRNFTVEENTGAGINIGTPVEATDSDDDDLTYSLEGADSASFEIVSVSGQIQTKTGVDYNHEATKNSYSVTVRAADDRGGSDTVAVTIAVTDSGVDEPPEAPDAPTVEAMSNSNTSLDVSWTAPENPGPAITDYDYQYKETSSSSWTVVDNTTITRTSATISSLDPNTSYDVQVRARNADGLSAWSGTGTGSTSEPVANRAPVFSEGANTSRTVSEGAQASSPVGAPVTATDADNDTLVYSLDGTDASSFDITSSSGQLLVGAGTVLDASTKATYSVTVVANDGTVTATIDVTITVTEVLDEPPSVPDAPTVSPNADSATSLDVSWVAPDNQGPPITDYDYRYRIARTPGGISIVHRWTEVDDTAITDTMETIENLTTGTSYEVQVRATNSSGTTGWSDSGTGTPTEPDTNNRPEFDAPSTTRSVPENASAGTPIGEPVTATDADNDTLTYSLEGTDAASFDITPATGQLLTEVALDAATKSTYTVTVVATDPSDTRARITVTITVTSVQDRCGVQGAVDPANTDLASDCEALLVARDVLVGLGSPLNWSASTPIAQWDGVTVDGTPMRVTTLDLRKMRLKGMISSHLSRVTALRELYLQDNHLTGQIPSELGSMTALTHLYADNNDLSGAIPSQMGSMTELSQLRLRSNDLSGPLPAALGSLTNLTHLLLSDNDLSGSIPSQIGDMSSLYWLDVGQNNISGTLPAELGNLSQLRRLYVYENDLTGSIPSTLGNLTRLTHIVAQENDLSGSIPVQLGNMSALVWMGLYDNDLSGAIPTQLSRLSNLQRLYLSNNDLTGTIPPSLGNLSALTNLWLDDNGLSGTIPSELDQLTNLVRWRMRGNDFTGCVPAGLAAIRSTDFDQLGLPVCSGS